jgi:hypothetical protein
VDSTRPTRHILADRIDGIVRDMHAGTRLVGWLPRTKTTRVLSGADGKPITINQIVTSRDGRKYRVHHDGSLRRIKP